MSVSTCKPGVNSQEWNQAQDSAQEAAASMGEMVGHAASAVGAMASQAVCDVGQKADDITASAGLGIQELGDKLSENAPDAGVLGSASQAVARTVKQGGEYVQSAKLSGMTHDVCELIREYPITAVLIGVGLGWTAARLLKR